MPKFIVPVSEEALKLGLRKVVWETVQGTINALLEKEAAKWSGPSATDAPPTEKPTGLAL